MLTIMNYKDSLLIEFESGTAAYAEELDDDRIVDYSLNPGTPHRCLPASHQQWGQPRRFASA